MPRSLHVPTGHLARLLCLIALVAPATLVSSSVAQTPDPPGTPAPPETPDPPGTPVTPQDPGEDPPSDGEKPSSPPPEAKPAKLRPFPVVVVAGRQGSRSTRVTVLSVKGPRGARVVVRCLGRRCPMRRVVTRIPRKKRVRVKRAQRLYRAGLAIEVRVTARDRVGKYTKVRFRRGQTPSRDDACLQPGARRPAPCS